MTAGATWPPRAALLTVNGCIMRWQEHIRVYDGVTRDWIPAGEWNTIADRLDSSGIVAPDPDAVLTAEQQHELLVQLAPCLRRLFASTWLCGRTPAWPTLRIRSNVTLRALTTDGRWPAGS